MTTEGIKWTKTWRGYYLCKSSNIEIILSKCTGGWEYTICDYNGNDDDNTYQLFHNFSDTKKQGIKFLVKWIKENQISLQ